MRRLSALFLVAIALGCLFRLANLDSKVYWHDETYTAMFATGRGNSEVADALFDGQLKTAAAVLEMQTVMPERGLRATVQQIAINDAQHPPIYYLLTRLMLYVLPDTILASRLVAAIAGVLLIPSIYWLSLILFSAQSFSAQPFQPQLTAQLSAALVALSPFHYLYAQEARPYSLWALTFVLASIAYLKALEHDTRRCWLAYTLVLSVSLYSCLLSLLVVISHGLHFIWLYLVEPLLVDPLLGARSKPSSHHTVRRGFRQTVRQRRRLFCRFVLSVSIGLLPALHWLSLVTTDHVNKISWTALHIPLRILIDFWIANLTRLFFDLNVEMTTQNIYSLWPSLLILGFLGFTLLWSLWRMPVQPKGFLICLGGVTLVAFVGPDLLLGGQRSSVSRYLVPTYLSLQLSCAYFLSYQITARRSLAWKKILWKTTTVVILCAGLLSCTVSLPADTWWHKKNSHLNPKIARLIQPTADSLLISSDYNVNLGEILSLSHRLPPNQQMLLFKEADAPDNLSSLLSQAAPFKVNSLFVFNLSPALIEQIQTSVDYQIEPKYLEGALWQLKNVESVSHSP